MYIQGQGGSKKHTLIIIELTQRIPNIKQPYVNSYICQPTYLGTKTKMKTKMKTKIINSALFAELAMYCTYMYIYSSASQ